jgi:microcystin-dependent protein
MSAEPFFGEIMMWAGDFAPRNWAFCNGQLLPINQYQPLYALIGTTYGGNGQTTFALPDLRGRVPMHWGSGQGLTPRSFGEQGGSPNLDMVSTTVAVPADPLDSRSAGLLGSGGVPAAPPTLALSFVICLNGYWPSRD